MSKLTGKVRKFGRYSKTQLQKAKLDLSLSMDEERLQFCADYYRTVERRDPLISELRLLDTLSQKLPATVSTVSIDKFLTNDKFVAETYADMIEKKRIMYPDASSPLTLFEASTVANNYLEYTGKLLNPPNHALLLEDYQHTSRTSRNCEEFIIPNSHHQIRVLKKTGLTGNPVQGDVLMLFLPTHGTTTSHYQKHIRAFLKDIGDTAAWKNIYPIRVGGLLPSLLLQLPVGVSIDISRLTENDTMLSLIPLTETFTGYHFAVLPAEDAKEVFSKSEKHGIHAICFASVTNDDRITVTVRNDPLFSLKSDFLHSLLYAAPSCAELSREIGLDNIEINHTPLSATPCAYLKSKNEKPLMEIAEMEGTLCASASCEMTESFYQSAFYTALCPIVSLAASGRAYTEQRLAIGLTIPEIDIENTKGIGNSLSAMLGLYRLQAELGIPAATISRATDIDCPAPWLTVYSVSEGDPLPTSLRDAGNTVYCLYPTTDRNGIPHADLLRTFLRDLTARSRNHSIVSARILCNESITDGLLKMNRNGLYCRMENDSIASHGALPIGVLIECKNPIPGMQPIGTVELREEVESESVEAEVLEAPASMIWSDQTEFVIFSPVNDVNAQILDHIITQKGGNVHRFENNSVNFGAFSRSLLGAHVLIVCGNIDIPNTEYVQFALDTMTRAGGMCWSVGRTDDKSEIPGFVTFRKAIPEELLDRILTTK